MKPIIALPVLTISCAVLLGCAGLSDAQCRGANWYDMGYRDARFKLQSQDTLYARQCERYGIPMDLARYNEGFRQGRWDFPDRTPL